MRFFVVNMTGTTIHVRLDRGTDDKLVLTVSKRQIRKGRPVTEYVIATPQPVHIGYLDDGAEFTFNNPEKLIVRLSQDGDRDAIMRIDGFLN